MSELQGSTPDAGSDAMDLPDAGGGVTFKGFKFKGPPNMGGKPITLVRTAEGQTNKVASYLQLDANAALPDGPPYPPGNMDTPHGAFLFGTGELNITHVAVYDGHVDLVQHTPNNDPVEPIAVGGTPVVAIAEIDTNLPSWPTTGFAEVQWSRTARAYDWADFTPPAN